MSITTVLAAHGSALGLLSMAWHLFGAKATSAAEAGAKTLIDKGFTALEGLTKNSAALTAVLQKADAVSDDVVLAEIANASAVVSKDGFTKAALADLAASSLTTLKSTLTAEEQTLLGSTPGALTALSAKVTASVAAAVAGMKTYKLAGGQIVKLPAGAPLPEAGATLIASA
jgi:hypothetical protein